MEGTGAGHSSISRRARGASQLAGDLLDLLQGLTPADRGAGEELNAQDMADLWQFHLALADGMTEEDFRHKAPAVYERLQAVYASGRDHAGDPQSAAVSGRIGLSVAPPFAIRPAISVSSKCGASFHYGPHGLYESGAELRCPACKRLQMVGPIGPGAGLETRGTRCQRFLWRCNATPAIPLGLGRMMSRAP